MKKELTVFGVIAALGVGFVLYYKKSTAGQQVNRGAITGNFKGYTSLMKLPSRYYNATSMENQAPAVATYSPGSIVDSWGLGSNGGNAEVYSNGWQAMPDSYSAEVSNAWLQSEAQAARL